MDVIILMLCSVSVVQVGNTLMVEWSDGSLSEFKCYVKLSDSRLFMLGQCTREKIVSELKWFHDEQHMESRSNLHMRKVQTLGWDYAQRGYR